MSNLAKSILMLQAPERPTWFTGHDIPEEPKEPSKIIERYSDLGKVVNLLESWIGDPNWDLDNTYTNPNDYPEGVDATTFEQELNAFANRWETYWKLHYEWRNATEMVLDIQWRVYWAELVFEELKGNNEY